MIVALCAGFGLQASGPHDAPEGFDEHQQQEGALKAKEQELRMEKRMLTIENNKYKYSNNYAHSPKIDQAAALKSRIESPKNPFKLISDWISDWWNGDRRKTVGDQLSDHHDSTLKDKAFKDAAGEKAYEELRPDKKEDALNEWNKVEKAKNDAEYSEQIEKEKQELSELDDAKSDIEKDIKEFRNDLAKKEKLLNTLKNKTKLNFNEKKNLAALPAEISALEEKITSRKAEFSQHEHEVKMEHLDSKIDLQKKFNARIDAFVQQMQALSPDVEIKYNVDTREFEFHDKKTAFDARAKAHEATYHRAGEDIYAGLYTGTSEEREAAARNDVIQPYFENQAETTQGVRIARPVTGKQPESTVPAQNRNMVNEPQIKALAGELEPVSGRSFGQPLTLENRRAMQDRSPASVELERSALQSKYNTLSFDQKVSSMSYRLDHYESLKPVEQKFVLEQLSVAGKPSILSRLSPELRTKFMDLMYKKYSGK